MAIKHKPPSISTTGKIGALSFTASGMGVVRSAGLSTFRPSTADAVDALSLALVVLKIVGLGVLVGVGFGVGVLVELGETIGDDGAVFKVNETVDCVGTGVTSGVLWGICEINSKDKFTGTLLESALVGEILFPLNRRNDSR